ncbi:DUF445 domain-containing protein [Altericroceibacterium endophyticum]|uniref:DUF445 family protein n=1 Tax=Altericroceibacterium endophyticum TaxID=1808508 RepID=A0A6I4T392_9SPHN|nr:DUF445 domain-containing protein [Altericroceibacterium endophyticum]MXO65714.1 DUF445 family protein [Altericroceibacterium endophyticum]
MRVLATGLLVVMGALFLLARHYEGAHPAWPYVMAFAEAAMVGGLADWFAVTALFRHPLGLPIPHTAIIPSNKNRIADSMAAFLQANFLTPAVVARRLRDMNLARSMGAFLADPEFARSSRIRGGASELFAQVLETLDPDRLGAQVKSGLALQLERVRVAPLLGQMLSAAIADKRHIPVMESLIRWAGLTLEDNEDLVRAMVAQRANALLRWTGLDDRLANSVLDGLYKLLAEVLINPDHPMRAKLEEGLESLAHDLQYDPKMQARVEGMKAELLANPALGDWWQGVWERLRHRMIDMARNPGDVMSGQLGDSIRELGQSLQDNPALQLQVNRFARRTAVGIASRYGGQIVRLVSETVKRWDAKTVSARIEGAVGRDLQFIRINGTLVGGLVGLTLHILGHVL